MPRKDLNVTWMTLARLFFDEGFLLLTNDDGGFVASESDGLDSAGLAFSAGRSGIGRNDPGLQQESAHVAAAAPAFGVDNAASLAIVDDGNYWKMRE